MVKKTFNYILKISKIIFFLIIWVVLFSEILFNPEIKEHIFHLLEEHPIIAPFIFIIIQIIFAIFALPGSPLTIFAGILWGLWMGIIYSTLATLFASVSTFILGRYLLREKVEKSSVNEWYLKILALIDKYNWKASLIAHINPLFPASPLGYAFGLSKISLIPFIYGVILGTLPLQFALVGIGDLSNFMLDISFISK